MQYLLVALCVVSTALAAPPPNRPMPVTSLPGYPGPHPSKMFSGYLNIETTAAPNQSMYMHYVLLESEGNPATDPTIIWYNGGPGASSMWGLMVELGPLLLNDDSILDPGYNASGGRVPQFQRNPNGWTSFANVIAFDNPPPVGFSYCDPPGPWWPNGTACGAWNDTRVALTNAEAVFKLFTEHFPGQYLSNGVYIVGESYAGVYIPGTAQALLANASYAAVSKHILGLALGDACLGDDVLCGGSNGPYWNLLFMYGHSQFSTEIWDSINTVCTMKELKGKVHPISAPCNAEIAVATAAVGTYYGYNLYDSCPPTTFQPRRSASLGQVPHTFEVGYTCPGQAFFQWVNLTEVRAALSVPDDAFFFMADNGGGMVYHYNERNVLTFIQSVLPGGNAQQMRILAYDGDTDPMINSFVTQDVWYHFAKNMSYQRTQSWRPWVVQDGVTVGGYVTEWINGTLSFLTVRGSGHMVPEFKGAAAAEFIGDWVAGRDYPAMTGKGRAKRGARYGI